VTESRGDLLVIEEKELDLFLTDNYKVLSLMNKPCYLVGGTYTSITQKEIADELGFNIMKANSIIKRLIEMGYVQAIENHRGRYIVTEKAKAIIEKIER
jgi:DNA-binding MarR family transcriptional regulator